MSDMITYFGNVDKYGGVIQFSSDIEGTYSVYSDRMYSWNSEKYNECCQKIWNNMGQCFYKDRQSEDVERFLRMYTGDDTLVLCKIIRYENQSNGYPYWRFDYISNKQ